MMRGEVKKVPFFSLSFPKKSFFLPQVLYQSMVYNGWWLGFGASLGKMSAKTSLWITKFFQAREVLWNDRLFIYLFILFIYLFTYLFIYTYIYLYVYLFIYSFVYSFIYLFIYLFTVYINTHPSKHQLPKNGCHFSFNSKKVSGFGIFFLFFLLWWVFRGALCVEFCGIG